MTYWSWRILFLTAGHTVIKTVSAFNFCKMGGFRTKPEIRLHFPLKFPHLNTHCDQGQRESCANFLHVVKQAFTLHICKQAGISVPYKFAHDYANDFSAI